MSLDQMYNILFSRVKHGVELPMEEIKIGDELVAFHAHTNKPVFNKITNIKASKNWPGLYFIHTEKEPCFRTNSKTRCIRRLPKA